MQTIYVDTNVFLRFILWDIPDQSAEAEVLFQSAVEKENRLHTSELVIAEIVWTLESFYKKAKQEIADLIRGILNTPNLSVANADLIVGALDEYIQKNVDFIDAYSAAYMRKNNIFQIKTFDEKHFKRFTDLKMIRK